MCLVNIYGQICSTHIFFLFFFVDSFVRWEQLSLCAIMLGNQKRSWFCDWAGRALTRAKVSLKAARLGWSRPVVKRYSPAGREVSTAVVQWFSLHYIDGLQLLNLHWPSADSNAGHWGVRDEKKIGKGWATKIYPTKQSWISLFFFFFPSLRLHWRMSFYYFWLGSRDWIWCLTHKDVL